MKLKELAPVIRSKNAGPYELTLDVLLKEIYPQISDRRYGNPLVAYTILLGDYNAELWTNESEIWQAPLKASRGGKKPAVMKTDGMGVVYSNQYDGRAIKTVQTS